MAENYDPSGLAPPASKYENQPLSARMEYGLKIDRYGSNFMAYLRGRLWEAMLSDNYTSLLEDPVFFYRASRNRLWETRRRANAKLVDKATIHGQMLDIWEAVMLDLLADDQPTAKAWEALTAKDDKQMRRTKSDYYPHLICNLGEADMMYKVDKLDGTRTPLKPVRSCPRDGRIQRVTTHYSLPSILPGSFDLRVFADDAYIRREKRFWEDALKILDRWIDGGNRIRRGNEWLVRHIVNNDIAMHVIFDNLSVECESRWFKNLGDNGRYEVAGRGKVDAGALPCIEDEIRSAVHNMINQFDKLDIAPSDAEYVMRLGGNEIFIPQIRPEWNIENIIFARMPVIADAYGGWTSSEFEIDHAPCPFTEENAEKAVRGLKSFVVDFEKTETDNLQRYKIGTGEMDDRVDELILNLTPELKTRCAGDEWRLVLAAFAHTKPAARKAEASGR